MYVPMLVYVLDIKSQMVRETNMTYVVCSSNKKQLLDYILDSGLHTCYSCVTLFKDVYRNGRNTRF